MKSLHISSTIILGFCFASIAHAQNRTTITVSTNVGDIPITLYDDLAPGTVANFLGYINRGDYDNSFFHRLIPGFVLQGGGFTAAEDGASPFYENISTQPPIQNEFGESNLQGTIAMAKLGGDPDSATSQWFINLDDNSQNLDTQNGGFTVFGEITDDTTLNLILTSSIIDVGGAFSSLPVFTNDPSTADASDLITINEIRIDSSIPEPSGILLLSITAASCLMQRKKN